jgi:hypothetical protein
MDGAKLPSSSRVLQTGNDGVLLLGGKVLAANLVRERIKPLSLGSGEQRVVKGVYLAGSPEGAASQPRGCRVGVGELGRETFNRSTGGILGQRGGVGNM